MKSQHILNHYSVKLRICVIHYDFSRETRREEIAREPSRR
jgi:hypothetical protein